MVISQDSVLAAGSSLSAGIAYDVSNDTGDPTLDLIGKIIVPIITGFLMPFLKDWLIHRRNKRSN